MLETKTTCSGSRSAADDAEGHHGNGVQPVQPDEDCPELTEEQFVRFAEAARERKKRIETIQTVAIRLSPLETKNLILDKAKFSDWETMWRNVWSRPESARYMNWRLTTSEEDAKIRILKTIEFQKTHDTYLVYEKAGKTAIGFAGVEQMAPRVYSETGICLGPDYVGRGYGKQILQCLITYCRDELDAEKFLYSSREENQPSNGLARALGFQLVTVQERTDERDGRPYRMNQYCLELRRS